MHYKSDKHGGKPNSAQQGIFIELLKFIIYGLHFRKNQKHIKFA